MLDRTDFASWQQCIRLYCQGKENGVNILKSIDEGPFHMGTFRETLAEGTEGALHLGPERPRVYSNLSLEDKERYNADIRATNILLQGLPKDIYSFINHYTYAKDIWDNMKMLLEVQDGRVVVQNVQGRQNKGQGNNARGAGAASYEGAHNKVGNANLGQARQVKCATENGVALDEEQLLFIAGGQDNAIDEDVDEQPVHDLALNVDNMFQANDCDAFDSDVDKAPTAQTMFMANLSSVDPVSDEAGLSYDSDILSENNVVDNSLSTELATYKEQVELYERRAMFELTEREQKIDEQLRIVIINCNIKEENLKKELHSVKMQLASTINHNKLMVEEVTSLKKDFKPKENKYLEEFLDMKALKEKAIGYKDPLCLTRTKQVQPALYNGYEINKNNHVPTLMHNTEDTLEIAEITRRKMNEKMKDPECVTHKVKIAPLDYSKENYLATFTPQKQLTPEQIFWSQDLIKIKEVALKKQTTASRPIKALMVYLPNTPTTLVPRVLLIKSQVKINIFALIQLFLEFEKTCKKRITPTGLTEGERGFEQTKKCYLTEVISFFKTLKEHFEGIQKPLTKEIKEMKDIFEELEAEVDQNVINKKHDEIERKNLLILNDNLIESVETLHEIVEETKVERPLDRLLASACLNTKHSQELLEYEIGCSKHMTEDRSQLRNFVKKFIGTVRFRNDHFGAIMGYGDYVIGDSVISRVYYVKGLGHNLFSVRKFCDSDLEIAFRKHSCYVQDTYDVELIQCSRGSNLYTISVEDMMKSSPICLLSKASKNKSWLWHRRLNHLNFGTINDLARKDLVRGLPRLKFEKDHLCSACQLGKSKKHTHKPKTENTNLEVLNTLYMDLCGPMRVQTINGKKYILVIVDDYSQFTWVKFLRLKDETPEIVIKFLKQNRTLIEAVRTMLIFFKALMFLWAEAVATACYTQNRSLIHTLHNKTPYELVHDKKPDLTFFRVFSALCYPINDSKDLGKLQPTADIGIFVGYAPSKKGYRIYNKRTRQIMETIHI
ncbi:retrovirus-related pol polyprotein from transposon TNT 1-94 [Tanacetum coccineum]